MTTPDNPDLRKPAKHDGGLRWGIKDSFVRYISTMEDGTRLLSGGARELSDGRFHFPLDDATGYDPPTRMGIVRFRGRLEFGGHLGMLYVRISDPWLHFHQDETILTIANGDGGQRLTFATQVAPVEQSRSGGGEHLHVTQPKLTEDGADLFGGGYSTGEPLDPINVTFPVREQE